MMPTLREWILDAAGDESVEAVVIGEMGWGDYGSEEVPGYADSPKDVLLTWAQAEPHLRYEFSSGFGAHGCQAIYAWTKSKIIFVSQYDGATGINSIPRHPIDCKPDMPGG